ncbi:MAG: formylglycine-generating enzyme family protein, partial [Planctomycetaceae bacterium]
EVTVERFAEFLQATGPGAPPAEGADPHAPRMQVSWFEAVRYCNWLSAQEGLPPEQWCYEEREGTWMPVERALERTGYRLPTEAEWEVACRAGTTTARPYGGTEWHLPRHAWYHANSEDGVHAVGQLQPNDWGLFDLLGNVSEWCHEAFVRDPTRGTPAGEVRLDGTAVERFDPSVPRVLRGGAFSGLPNFIRSGFRGSIQPGQRRNFIGFRTARTVPSNQ